jgi:hypothetical protein
MSLWDGSWIAPLAATKPPTTRAGDQVHRHQQLHVSGIPSLSALEGHDPIATPAFIIIKMANELNGRTPSPKPRWEADFTYLKVIGWGR